MFQPAVPLGGIAGYRVLQATLPVQQEAFVKSPQIERNSFAYIDRIQSIRTAEELVADRQLFEVALGAYGLDEEIDKAYFMRRMLEEGTDDPQSLANQFVDPRYGNFSEAFGFGNASGPRTDDIAFALDVVSNYQVRQFEIAVGNADESLRLALNASRELPSYAASERADDSAWFNIMGNLPLRTVFEGAYNLPTAFAQLDVEKQREMLQDRTDDLFGDTSLAVFSDPEKLDGLITRFLAQSQVNSGPSAGTPGMAALSLLQGASGLGAGAQIGLILSNASL